MTQVAHIFVERHTHNLLKCDDKPNVLVTDDAAVQSHWSVPFSKQDFYQQKKNFRSLCHIVTDRVSTRKPDFGRMGFKQVELGPFFLRFMKIH